MIIDETRHFTHTLRFRECPDQPGYFATDDLDALRIEVRLLQAIRRLPACEEQTMTRIPLAWVVTLQNEYPFFTEDSWTYEHQPQEQRLNLSSGPYFQVGDRVRLHDSAAFYLDRVLGRSHTVVEVYDHDADPVEAGGIPEYRPEEGRIYRLDTLSELISHRVLRRKETPDLERLFQRHQQNDVRIVSYVPDPRRQAVCLGPSWESAPDEGEWLTRWRYYQQQPIYLYLTLERVQARLASWNTDPLSHFEHASYHALTGEVESVYVCAPDGQRLWQFWYSPWEEDEQDVLYFDTVSE